MSLDLTGVRLMLLTDRSQLPLGRGLVRTVAECVEAGLTHVVVRELDEPQPARAALVAALVDVGASVIAARTPLHGAAAVHLPACAQAGGADRGAWGRSCHSADEVAAAEAEGAVYAFLSPYAEGGSKPGRDPLAPDAFAGHAIPVYALGGIAPTNARAAIDAGAHGVAVMGAVMRAAEPADVVRELLEAVR
ncbi:thiamine phosphate synthase [Nocardioides ultimimeridianus]